MICINSIPEKDALFLFFLSEKEIWNVVLDGSSIYHVMLQDKT